MKNTLFISSLVFLISFPSVASDTLVVGPLSDTWRKQKVVVIPEGDHFLERNTTIVADSLELRGRLFTLGHELVIDVKNIKAHEGANIQGFRNSVEDLTFRPPVAPARLDRGKDGVGHGASGGEGPAGNPGENGANGRDDSRPISIFTDSIDGELIVIGSGEDGQSGQQGGKGGRGGDGIIGTPGRAKASCLGSNSVTHGGRGGASGLPGIGGKGGRGGNGGNPVKVKILFSQNEIKNKIDAKSLNGVGGNGGIVGLSGDAGNPGPGGNAAEDNENCVFWTETAKANQGPTGHKTQRSLTQQEKEKLTGKSGQSYVGEKNEKVDFHNLTNLRQRSSLVRTAAFDFHLERVFALLVERSLNFAFQHEMTLEQVGQLTDQQMISMLNQIDQAVAEVLSKDWRNYFLDPIQELIVERESAGQSVQNLLEKEEQAKILIESLGLKKDKLQKIAEEASFGVQSRLKSLNLNCRLYLREKSNYQQRTPFISRVLDLPTCEREQLEILIAKPLGGIRLMRELPSQLVYPAHGLKGYEIINRGAVDEKARDISQSLGFEVVVINGQTYRRDAFQMVTGARQDEEVKNHHHTGFEEIKKSNIELKDLRHYLKVLSNVQ